MSGSGGLLNLVSVGQNNKILLGNPSISSFKAKYCKTKNFGKQAFRLDYDGQRILRLTESSTFQFSIVRHADLLLDTFLCINLPDIWSPIYNPCDMTQNRWSSYDFKWIEDIGFQMIEEVTITAGALVLGKYSGAYLSNVIERDYPTEKKDLIRRSTGNIIEVYEPAQIYSRANCYPSAMNPRAIDPNAEEPPLGTEPSIRGRQLIIPINTWYTQDHRCAFPLVSLPYNELVITVRLRPIQELFRVRDIFDMANNNPYIQPDFNRQEFALYRFLQTPPVDLAPENYPNKLSNWNADIHLICNYVFLDKEERQEYAKNTQLYLVKDVYEYLFENKVGTSKSQLLTNGLVANWMFYFQRNDVNMRNEWNNYTNYPYTGIPKDVYYPNLLNPADNTNTGYFITGDFSVENQKEILVTLGIVMDGNYRENTMTSGFYNYIEKYKRSAGGGKDGLYFYNFGLDTGNYQPTGAMNMSKFRTIEFEYTTLVPAIDAINSKQNTICDLSGNVIAVFKSNYRLFQYAFNLIVQEERYNVLTFQNGYCGLLYSR